MIPFSVLDLCPVTEGGTPAQSFKNSLDLAQHAECWGYKRYWIAEHHNMPGIASAATSIVMTHIASGTKTIRVGAGGIMLPNHAPLVIAEQFGTLESLFPGRIDLGLGRAPGGNHATARALRRTLHSDPDAFPHDVLELLSYFHPEDGQLVRAVPGSGLKIPIWILGSSLFGAQVAAMMGFPFAFASHFAAAQMMPAITLYRERFQPSGLIEKPQVMLGVNVVAADTDDEAKFLATSGRQAFANLRRGMPTTLPPPHKDFEKDVVPFRGIRLEDVQSVSMVGSPDTVRADLEDFIERTRADELIVASHIYDHPARLRSYELVAAKW
ncbi:MAG: LLM class flavin-dependent oxidoreductase [Vicinamibacterales bacterium]